MGQFAKLIAFYFVALPCCAIFAQDEPTKLDAINFIEEKLNGIYGNQTQSTLTKGKQHFSSTTILPVTLTVKTQIDLSDNGVISYSIETEERFNYSSVKTLGEWGNEREVEVYCTDNFWNKKRNGTISILDIDKIDLGFLRCDNLNYENFSVIQLYCRDFSGCCKQTSIYEGSEWDCTGLTSRGFNNHDESELNIPVGNKEMAERLLKAFQDYRKLCGWKPEKY